MITDVAILVLQKGWSSTSCKCFTSTSLLLLEQSLDVCIEETLWRSTHIKHAKGGMDRKSAYLVLASWCCFWLPTYFEASSVHKSITVSKSKQGTLASAFNSFITRSSSAAQALTGAQCPENNSKTQHSPSSKRMETLNISKSVFLYLFMLKQMPSWSMVQKVWSIERKARRCAVSKQSMSSFLSPAFTHLKIIPPLCCNLPWPKWLRASASCPFANSSKAFCRCPPSLPGPVDQTKQKTSKRVQQLDPWTETAKSGLAIRWRSHKKLHPSKYQKQNLAWKVMKA